MKVTQIDGKYKIEETVIDGTGEDGEVVEIVEKTYLGDINENNKRHGSGTVTWSNGQTLTGLWDNGVLSGEGTITFLNGVEYKGTFNNQIANYTSSNGSTYNGGWLEGKNNGQGTYTWSDGRKYVGEWTDGLAHGDGIYTTVTGESYEGLFLNGFIYDTSGVEEIILKDFKTDETDDPKKCIGDWLNGDITENKIGLNHNVSWKNGEYVGDN